MQLGRISAPKLCGGESPIDQVSARDVGKSMYRTGAKSHGYKAHLRVTDERERLVTHADQMRGLQRSDLVI